MMHQYLHRKLPRLIRLKMIMPKHSGIPLLMAYIWRLHRAKYVDLAAAASVLKGRKIASGITLKVAPASKERPEPCRSRGHNADFRRCRSGNFWLIHGICAGYGADRLAENDVCYRLRRGISKGRMGAASSQVALCLFPGTGGGLSLAGTMIDPREVAKDEQGDMGRIWQFGDSIDTDVLAPGQYMKSPLAELAAHCLEAVRPEFAAEAKQGDIVLAGNNFGVGSSREQAAEILKF